MFFVIDISTRRVHLAGIVHRPTDQWMKQVAGNLTDSLDGFLAGRRFLIVDRDPLYTTTFRRLLSDQGVDLVRIPPRSPNLNAYAERFVRTVRNECLDHIIPLGQAHLRRALREFLTHYHQERNHQGLDNALIDPRAGPANDNGRVLRKQRIGGLLNFYYRGAA